MRFLDSNLIKVGSEAVSAVDAIQEAGDLLVNEELIEEGYVRAMINSYKENGPYFVLAPQIAIPHARPEDGVNEASVSLVQLKNPVTFGHESNDPVHMVFGLGASSSEEHLTLLKKLTTLLNDRENVEALIHADRLETIQKILGKEV